MLALNLSFSSPLSNIITVGIQVTLYFSCRLGKRPISTLYVSQSLSSEKSENSLSQPKAWISFLNVGLPYDKVFKLLLPSEKYIPLSIATLVFKSLNSWLRSWSG